MGINHLDGIKQSKNKKTPEMATGKIHAHKDAKVQRQAVAMYAEHCLTPWGREAQKNPVGLSGIESRFR